MAFLSGSVTFERFRVTGKVPKAFGEDQLEILQKNAIGKFPTSSEDNIHVGFLAGSHLLDTEFDFDKNVIGDSLHCAIRIDTNQVPSAMKKAWLQMELANATAESRTGRPTKAQRTEAKEAVEQRCAHEASTGKYHRMQQFPILWDFSNQTFYFGGSSASAIGHCADLLAKAFNVELERMAAGSIASAWADKSKSRSLLESSSPAAFHPDQEGSEYAWLNSDAANYDFLGNEYLMWLWWYLDNESDSLKLDDGSEVTAMLSKTLSLECPFGAFGKETITSESPVQLSEAGHAIRSGKIPRKSGMIVNRFGQQFEFVLQAETFGVSGAKIPKDDQAEGRVIFESRIEAIRMLSETIDGMFHLFCKKRLSNSWSKELEKIRNWLKSDQKPKRRSAA
jgi:hypothetical protein